MDVEGSSSFSFLVLEELYISQGSDVHFFSCHWPLVLFRSGIGPDH